MSEPQIEAATMCFACGPDNPVGLKIDFTLNNGIVTAAFTANENHVGYENTVHGGIIYAALDDVMANVLYLQNIKAHTARCAASGQNNDEVGPQIADHLLHLCFCTGTHRDHDDDGADADNDAERRQHASKEIGP